MLSTAGRLLGKLVRHLVALHARVGRNPEDGDLVLAADQVRADLDGRSCPLLARAQCVGPDALDGRLRARGDSIAVAQMLALIANPQRLVYGEELRVEHLLIVAQVEAASCPAPLE